MMPAITEFQGDYRFLSNFWPTSINFAGLHFTSVEAAYQAAKSNDPAVWLAFSRMTASQSKQAGRRVQMRPDWDSIKIAVMMELTALKYAPGTALADQLLETGDARLIEGNHWGDRFWGVCKGTGLNHLGRILMSQRAQLAGGM